MQRGIQVDIEWWQGVLGALVQTSQKLFVTSEQTIDRETDWCRFHTTDAKMCKTWMMQQMKWTERRWEGVLKDWYEIGKRLLSGLIQQVVTYLPDNRDLEKRGGSITWNFRFLTLKIDSTAETYSRTQCLFFSLGGTRLVYRPLTPLWRGERLKKVSWIKNEFSNSLWTPKIRTLWG